MANKDKLTAIVSEYRAKGALDRRKYAVLRSSYAGHYRRMLPHLLSVLEFRSNIAAWRPVLDALDWIRGMQDSGRRFVAQEKVPTEAIPAKWRASIIDASG